jgi:uracil-DNA glycosylase family 4
MTKSEKLNLIVEKISQCEKCPAFKETTIKKAPGDGNPHAKIVILGEALGQAETEQGKSFVGKSGKLLSNILTACGINREDIFITNIVKCRPPGNRAPTPEESKNCRGFLDLQLKVIAPKFIVCLGTTATQNLLGVDVPITQMRGKWHEYQGIRVLPTFHPSYLLRQPAKKADVWEDFQLLLREI